MTEKYPIIINGNPLSFHAGETILSVAEQNHIDIPAFCYLKRAVSSGECGMCVVEIAGFPDLVRACETPASANMVIRTESPKVVEARRQVIRAMLASGNHNCAVLGSDNRDNWTQFQIETQRYDNSAELCPVWGDCRLQELAYRYLVAGGKYPKTETAYPMETINPFIIRDFSRCVGCGKCVRACNEVQVNNAIRFAYEGTKRKVAAADDKALKDSDCVFCGECVQACPVGALVEKDARYKVRHWETEKVRTTCSYCGVGCQMYLHSKGDEVVKVTGVDADVAPNYGSLCVKGRFGFDFINSPERLKHPLIKENSMFREASWDEALNLVAKKFDAFRKEHGSNSMGLLSSARISNEDNYIAQKFARAVLKTNNVDHCARLCHASTVAGLAAAFGSGAMTNPISDVKNSDVILITGSNPTENHPVMSNFIKQAVRFGKTKLIVADPREIQISKFAEIKLSQRLDTDVCWINGMMHIIIKENLYDKKFVEERTAGFDDVKKCVERYTPEFVENVTGIPAKDLIAAARMYAAAPAASIIYCMGITQHSTGTDNVKSLANLAMLCGNMGIPGGGVNPLRGQNNVQGACDMGALPNVFSGYQPVTNPDAVKKMAAAWGVEGLSDKPGNTVTQMLPMAHEGSLKALYIIGENPMLSDPDLNHTEECLKNLDFLVVQDIFITETARLADVVLPSACFAEKDGTVTNTERKVQRIRRAIPPPGAALSDWKITCEIATRMGYAMSYENTEAVFNEMAKVTPSYSGITYDRIEDDGLHWPCPTSEHPGTPILHIGQFTCGKGKFHAIEYLPPAGVADSEYPLYLTTGRILYHYHTGTMTMKSEGLNERAPECFAEISSKDADIHGICSGEKIRVASRRGEIEVKARVSDKILPGNIFIPFHYANAAANRLTNAALDPVCKIPEFKVCAVKVSVE